MLTHLQRGAEVRRLYRKGLELSRKFPDPCGRVELEMQVPSSCDAPRFILQLVTFFVFGRSYVWVSVSPIL